MVMAGGTGGHVFPGLAVADAMRARGAGVSSGWAIQPGWKARLVAERGYDMAPVRFGALRGKGLLRKLLLPVALLSGFWQALRQIRRVRPSVVLGMGGYISFPGGMMAVLLGKPLALHEQNSVAGLANRVLAKVADRILAGFPDVLPGAIWAGNPVRPEISAPAGAGRALCRPRRCAARAGARWQPWRRRAQRHRTQGLALIPEEERPQVVHQSGEKASRRAAGELRRGRCCRALRGLHRRHGGRLRMGRPGDLSFGRADRRRTRRCRCRQRAGAVPHAVDDHQTANARFLSQSGGAIRCRRRS